MKWCDCCKTLIPTDVKICPRCGISEDFPGAFLTLEELEKKKQFLASLLPKGDNNFILGDKA